MILYLNLVNIFPLRLNKKGTCKLARVSYLILVTLVFRLL